MIRKINENDNNCVLEFLYQEKEFNLFIIGDIENFGYYKDFQEVWGEYEGEKLKAVLLRYYDSYIFYANGDFDLSGFAEIINKDKKINDLSGKTETILKFEKNIKFNSSKKSYFSILKELKTHDTCVDEIKIANVNDVDNILNLKNMINEFSYFTIERESLITSTKSKVSRYYYIEKDEEFISMAASLVETKELAMVGSVCTNPNFREQGLASKCVIKLCKDLMKDGKTPCLFYHNPKAGQIYRRIGFEEIGGWISLIK